MIGQREVDDPNYDGDRLVKACVMDRQIPRKNAGRYHDERVMGATVRPIMRSAAANR